MKTLHSLMHLATVAMASIVLFSCSLAKDEPAMPDGEWASDGYISGDGGSEPAGEEGTGNSQAGRLTAGEWSDLDNWAFWSNLINGQDYGQMATYWGYNTNGRVAVRLQYNNVACCGVPVEVLDAEGQVLAEGVTDNHGCVNLFPALFANALQLDSTVQVRFQDKTEQARVTFFGDSLVCWNTYEATYSALSGTDILFIVDATGSMGDEITFLKDDLLDILNKANVPDLQTAALFYRDEGDDYVTRVSDMNTNVASTVSFIRQQKAEGGGDYPEAVHTALDVALQQVSWRDNARVKLAFMLLDAPPHYESAIVKSIHESNRLFAANGIRIIPIAASGIDKNTEFLLRFLAMTTDGTYTFLTNDSGIGGDHIAPSVGDYEVELLNALVLRLIQEFTE